MQIFGSRVITIMNPEPKAKSYHKVPTYAPRVHVTNSFQRNKGVPRVWGVGVRVLTQHTIMLERDSNRVIMPERP